MRLPLVCMAAAMAFSVAAGPASAQFDPEIEISASQYAYECQLINDSGPGVRTVYVRYNYNYGGSTASRFMVTLAPGVDMTYLSETHPFSGTVGDTQNGITVCYGECTTGLIIVASIDYMYNGSTVSCGRLQIVPHPDAETVETMGCDGSSSTPIVRDMYILAPGGICGCPAAHTFSGTPQSLDCSILAVAAKTWGAVKALYRD